MAVATKQETDYRFAGRTFRPAVPMTAHQVGYFGAHLRMAKAESYVLPSQAGHAESFDALVESLLVSEHLYYLLAASLTEVVEGCPLPWGNVRADQTARMLAGLTAPDDIAALRPAIWEVLAGFFPRPQDSRPISPSSSPLTMAEQALETVDALISAAGATSPAPLPDTTGTGRKRSSGGRRGKSASPTASD